MIFPTNEVEIAELLASDKRLVILFMTAWCGDCHYIKPQLPAIEQHFPEMVFVQLDRDDFMSLAQEWQIFGIPSLVVVEKGKEIGRFVNRNRKTKQEIIDFLEGMGQ